MDITRIESIARVMSGRKSLFRDGSTTGPTRASCASCLVRDGSGFVQCVAFKGDLPEARL